MTQMLTAAEAQAPPRLTNSCVFQTGYQREERKRSVKMATACNRLEATQRSYYGKPHFLRSVTVKCLDLILM